MSVWFFWVILCVLRVWDVVVSLWWLCVCGLWVLRALICFLLLAWFTVSLGRLTFVGFGCFYAELVGF